MKTITGIFEDTEPITIISGFAANHIALNKIVITNTDTANIIPKINLHNIVAIGDDDEYIQVVPEIVLAPGQRLIYDSFLMFFANQNLEVELSSAVETTQPQYMVITKHV